jgi:predicted lipid-binding transport protein (Tim44 family)
MDSLRQATAAAPGPVPPSHPPGQEPTPSPDQLGMVDVARRLIEEGSATMQCTTATLQSLKELALAEASLATAAAGRMAIFGVAGAILGLVATIYLFGTLAAVLVALGLPWWASLGIVTLLLFALVGFVVWRIMALVKMTRFDGTRRQIARIREGNA